MYCVYCPQTDECYYFDPKRFDKSLTLRIAAPKNNQEHNVKFAKDYRFEAYSDYELKAVCTEVLTGPMFFEGAVVVNERFYQYLLEGEME